VLGPGAEGLPPALSKNLIRFEAFAGVRGSMEGAGL
jgi:hypothetical protein